MRILDLGQVIFGDLDNQIAWFQQKNLLSLQSNCFFFSIIATLCNT